MKTKNIVIVGAGSAGISAAETLGKYGLPCTLVDENSKIGGVVYRGPIRQTQQLPHLDLNYRRSMSALHTRYERQKQHIKLSLETSILGPESDQSLLAISRGKMTSIPYDALILSTGCHERSVPFPGWQLPGVMLLGGVQLQIKSGLVRPGARMALVGTGPLLPLVAVQLHKAGVNVVGVYEASQFHKLAKEAVALLNIPRLMLNGLSLMAYLKKHDIPFHYGWGVVSAEGTETVQHLQVAPYDSEWRANHKKRKTLDVDAVGVGYGFVARTHISQLMGLDHEYQLMSGYVPAIDSALETSKPNVFVAGDSSGILGSDGAIYEGRIAATRIAERLGAISTAEAETNIQKFQARLTKIRNFRFGFDRFSERKLGLLALPESDTVVCRCENVRRNQIDQALNEGIKDITTLKMRTRVGMGDCQGKICGSYCYDRFEQAGMREQMGLIRPRFPLDPIPFSALEETE